MKKTLLAVLAAASALALGTVSAAPPDSGMVKAYTENKTEVVVPAPFSQIANKPVVDYSAVEAAATFADAAIQVHRQKLELVALQVFNVKPAIDGYNMFTSSAGPVAFGTGKALASSAVPYQDATLGVHRAILDISAGHPLASKALPAI